MLAAVLIVFSLTGSTCLGVDKTNEILSNAIVMLEQESASWEAMLTDTRDKLIAEGKKTLAVQVDNLLQDALQSTGIEVRCYTDFLRDRVTNDLKRILAKNEGKPPPGNPKFCNPSPDSIDMSLVPTERRAIRIDGFNLSRAVVKAKVEGSSGAFTNVTDYVDDPSTYLLTLNLAAIEKDQPTVLQDGRRIIFTLGSAPDTATENSVALLPVVPDPEPIYAKTLVSITGTIHLHDYDWESPNEDVYVPVNQTLIVRSGATQPTTWSFSKCLDSEVQGDVWMEFTLNKDTGVVDAVGQAYYWEGSSCADEIQDTNS